MESHAPVLSEHITETEPRASTEWSFFTMAFRFDILNTPRASVTVVTIGNPSGMAATARETGLQPSVDRAKKKEGMHTSNGKHI
jgi:hypothetical protein